MIDWDLRQVGFLEMGLVLHCRASTVGEYAHSLSAELDLINDLYRNELRLYKNFFQPLMRLERKERVDGKKIGPSSVSFSVMQ